MSTKQVIGDKIKRLRNEKGLSVTKFSYAVGISYSHLKKIEDGITSVQVDTLQSICNALDISIFNFFDDDYFKTMSTDALFNAINKLTESERKSVQILIDEINKYKNN